MPVKPNTAEKETMTRLLFCVGEAIEEGIAWAERTTPGARQRVEHLLANDFRPRMTIERTPTLQVSLELIGNHPEHGPSSVEVFRYVADDGRQGLH